jgi:sterol desaturase/sphingolipid hydroxylase (fatty acid hydroxylase superfamily)
MSPIQILARIPFIPYGIALYSSVSAVHILLCERYIVTEFLYYFAWSTAIYTFVEYAAHRALHSSPPLIRIHNKHHRAPTNQFYIHTPVLFTAGVVMGLPYIITYISFEWIAHCIMWSIGPLHYIGFELTHKYSHTARIPIERLKNIQSYHRAHHRDGNTNYGFTTPLWDIVFGTLSRDCSVSIAGLVATPIPFATFLIDGDAMFRTTAPTTAT